MKDFSSNKAAAEGLARMLGGAAMSGMLSASQANDLSIEETQAFVYAAITQAFGDVYATCSKANGWSLSYATQKLKPFMRVVEKEMSNTLSELYKRESVS